MHNNINILRAVSCLNTVVLTTQIDVLLESLVCTYLQHGREQHIGGRGVTSVLELMIFSLVSIK